jgi:hypothetical protein
MYRLVWVFVWWFSSWTAIDSHLIHPYWYAVLDYTACDWRVYRLGIKYEFM